MPQTVQHPARVMDRDAFRAVLAAPIEAGFGPRYGALVGEHGLWREAMALSLDPEAHVAFRASAALEYAYFRDPAALALHRDEFLRLYLRLGNPSAWRHWSKILEHLLRTGRLTLTDAQAGRVAEATFALLIDPGVRVAVKVWAMEILYGLGGRLPWVDEQLGPTVRHLMADGSPGMRSHGAKLCAKLKKRAAGTGTRNA